jgi:hypothetical protein
MAVAELDTANAAAFCAGLPLVEESKQLIKEKMSVPEFLDVLIGQERWIDAVQVLARMMPARESVWWAVQCATNCSGPSVRAQETTALRAAEKWVTEMTEESRYAAFDAAQKARLGSPANCVAMAAFVAGPSLAPHDVDPLPPHPDLAAQMVAGTVMASGFFAGFEQSAERLRFFLEQGKALYQQLATRRV